MTNIQRWDSDERSQHYWTVKFQSVGIQKLFSDKPHGGKRKALAEAIKYRDKLKKEYPLSYTGDALKRGSYKNSKGIYLRTRGDTTEVSWVAFWYVTVKGKQKERQKSFSIHKYGTRKARQMALECRKEGVGK